MLLGFVRPCNGRDLLFEAIDRIDPPVRLSDGREFWKTEEKSTELAERQRIREQVTLNNRYVSTQEMVELLQEHNALVPPYRTLPGTHLPQIANACGMLVIISYAFFDELTTPHDSCLSDEKVIIGLQDEAFRFYNGGESGKMTLSPPQRWMSGGTIWNLWTSTCRELILYSLSNSINPNSLNRTLKWSSYEMGGGRILCFVTWIPVPPPVALWERGYGMKFDFI